MIYPHQYVAVFCLSLLFGFALSPALDVNFPWVIVSALLFALPLFLKSPHPLRLVAVAGLALCLGLLRYQDFTTLPANHIQFLTGRSVVLEGRIDTPPVVSSGRERFYLSVDTADHQPVVGRAAVNFRTYSNFRYGDVIKGEFKILPPEITPEFNEVANLLKDNIYVKAQPVGELQITGHQPGLRGHLYALRDWFTERIRSFLPEPYSSLLAGILLGTKESLDSELKVALNRSGTTHLVALSGYNIAVVAGLALWLFSYLPRRWALIFSGLFIAAFVLLTGASSSVVRAAIMGGVMLLANLWGRRRNLTNAIIVAGAVMVWVNPYILKYDISFQLSLAATCGIVFLVPVVTSWLKIIPAYLREILATTVAAQIATLPISIHYFQGVSLASLVTNLLILPLIPPVMLLGTVTSLLVWILPGLKILGWVTLAPLAFILKVITGFGALPYSYIKLPSLPAGLLAMLYLALVYLIYRYYDKAKQLA